MMQKFFILLFLSSCLIAELPLPPNTKVECGYLSIESKENKEEGKLFYIAYFKENEANRPLTFCFNGGPGAASVFFHLGGLGPLKITHKGQTLEQNPTSLFAYTDLVFIDAFATGFSRTAPDVDLTQYLAFEKDLETLSQGIVVFLNLYERWTSPLYLAGASYGVPRIIGIAAHLFDRYKTGVSGLLLVSGFLDFQASQLDKLSDFPYLFAFPTYVAIAKGNTKEAEAYVENRYVQALFLGDALPEKEAQKVSEELSTWTKLPKEEILKMRLRISPYHFREYFNEGKILGRFDAEVTSPSPGEVENNFHLDPSFIPLLPQYNQAIYLFLKEVGWHEDKKAYHVLAELNQRWKFLWKDETLNVGPMLRRLLYNNPETRVFAASGLYDLATPYYGMKYGLRHLLLDPETRQRVRFQTYEGGHMFYQNPPAMAAFKKDVKSLFEK